MKKKSRGAAAPDPFAPNLRFRRLEEGLGREYFFYCHDTKGVFRYVSRSITRVLGYSRKEFLKQFDKYLTPNPANEAVARRTALSIKGRRQPPYEVEIFHKNGTVRTLEVLETPVRQGGRVVAVEGIAKDITARKRLEALLSQHNRELEEQTRLILMSSGEGIIGVDRAGLVTFVNAAAQRMLGWTAAALRGKPLHETIHYKKADGAPYPRGNCPMNRALVRGREARLEETLWRRDGSGLPVIYSSRPIRKDGRITGAVITFSDITGRRRTEELKNLLIHAILHDLNTPLAVITAGAELSAECPAHLPGCANRDTMRMMSEAAVEMKRMLSDMLDIARMEEGRMRLALEPVAPADLVKRAAAELAPVARAAGRSIETCAEEGLPRVLADARQVKRVIANLLVNAMRYSPPASAIKVSASAGRAAGGVVFSVSDRGRGIDPAHLGRIFEKFFQLESGQAKSRQGKGLGLAFCRLAVESHGGRIWAENLPGGGCRFCFTLPRDGRRRARG
ncbi:MAG: sensor histidine kinase [Elusimicrobiales bacterium]